MWIYKVIFLWIICTSQIKVGEYTYTQRDTAIVEFQRLKKAMIKEHYLFFDNGEKCNKVKLDSVYYPEKAQ